MSIEDKPKLYCATCGVQIKDYLIKHYILKHPNKLKWNETKRIPTQE